MWPVPAVLADVPCRLNSSSHIAEIAVVTTGIYSGLQPAIIALIATFSAVISRLRVGISPTTSLAPSPAASRKRWWHYRQPVRQALLEIEFDSLDRVGHLESLRS